MCKKLVFLISFVVMVGLIGSAFATERHVGPGQRFTSIESAFNASSSGDIITVHANTDGSAKEFTFGGGFMKIDDSKHDITFRAYNNNGAQNYDPIIITSSMECAYKTGCTWEGFITHQGGAFHNGWVQWDRAGFVGGWHTIKNCIFSDLTTQALDYYPTSSMSCRNVTVENCTFMNLTAEGGITARKDCYDWTIKDCLFLNIKVWSTDFWDGTAVYMRGNDVYCDYCTFYNNGENLDTTRGNTYYGTWCTTDIPVQLANASDPCNPYFGYLTYNNNYAVLFGDSDGSYRGARPTPEPATIALLGLGGLVLFRKRR